MNKADNSSVLVQPSEEMQAPDLPPKRAGLVWIAVLSLLGALAVLWVTPDGAGVSPDGIRYLEGARHILHGEGYSTMTAGELQPITHWPPMFSISLAGLGLFGMEPWTASRWFNAFIMGLNIWLTGYLVFKHTRASAATAVFAAFVMLCSWDALQVHSCALSDPLFLAFSLIGLSFLLAYFERPAMWVLVASGAALSLATVSRYIGLPLIGAAASSLLLWRAADLKQRIKEAMILGSVSVLPFACFALRNRFVSQEPGGLGPGFRGLPQGFFSGTFHTLIAWFLPRGLPGILKLGVHAFALLVVVGLLVVLVRTSRNSDGSSRWRFQTLVPSWFFACYLGFYIFFVLFFFLDMRFEDVRYLMPIKPIAIVAISALLSTWLRTTARRKMWLLAAVAISATVCLGSLSRTIPWAREAREDGQAFASREWRLSETMGYVRKIPSDVDIYSNWYDVILLHTGRAVRPLPTVWDRYTEKPKTNYLAQLEKLRDGLKSHKSLVVFFTHKERNFIVDPPKLERDLPLALVDKTQDGIVYQLKDAVTQSEKADSQLAGRAIGEP